MAPENELLSSWREELRQQANQGSTAGREEELEGGGEEQEIELLMQQEDRCDQINSRYLWPNIG